MTAILTTILVVFICFIVGICAIYFGTKAADVVLSKLFGEE
jgi:ABC-type dipeptide/oligopeptide/nickel transport system permease subunit